MDIKDKVQSILSKYDYPEFQWVSSRPSIADLFKPDKRCGIYILKFSNEFYYVGQAVDVTRRYVIDPYLNKMRRDKVNEKWLENFLK